MIRISYLSRFLLAVLYLWAVLLQAVAAPQTGGTQGQPIRVGGNVQESKLVRRVEPIYPEEARAARISGVVILQTTITERGEVSDVRVLRGHPLLNKAAVEAVRQWQYQPTYLNGEAVSVIATVTVVFNPTGSPSLRLMIDVSGNIRDVTSGLEGDALKQKIRETKGGVLVQADPGIPFRSLQEILSALQREGAQNLQISPPYLFRESRLYHWATSRGAAGGTAAQPAALIGPLPVFAAEVALDTERLSSLARASAGLQQFPLTPTGRLILLYRLFISETGAIEAVEAIRAPRIPELETELTQTRVITPGRIGPDPIPVAVDLEIEVR